MQPYRLQAIPSGFASPIGGLAIDNATGMLRCIAVPLYACGCLCITRLDPMTVETYTENVQGVAHESETVG